MRKLALFAATSIAAMAVPSAANAQFVFDSVGDTTGTLNFNDFFNTGMSAQLTLTLTGLNTATGVYTFSYSLLNNSNAVNNPGSRVSSFGFNDNQANNPAGTINGTFDTIDTDGANYPNGIGVLNLCGFEGPGQCTGNGNGPTPGNTASGSFTLDYPTAVSSITLSSFAVRYQNTFQGGSSTGLVTTPVPEPATWAMMLVGFGAAGVALRRSRRRKVLLTQFA